MAKNNLFDEITEQYADVKLGTGAEVSNWIDTGSYSINKIISGDFMRGYPCGRIVEFFGDPSTGKSLLIYVAMANFQKQFKEHAYVILDDSEDVFTEHIANIVGIDVKRMILLGSETVEDHFERLFLGGKVGEEDKRKKDGLVPYILASDPEAKILIALDSVAMLSTRHEQDVAFDKDDMTKAKKLRAGIRMVNKRFISEFNILYLIANHVIANIGGYGNPKSTPGGKAIPFMSSVRLELSMKEKIKDKSEKVIGVTSKVEVKKNKVAAPFQKACVDIMFDKGLDAMSGVADMMVEEGLLREKQGWFEDADGIKFRRNELTPEMLKKLMKSVSK
jgi:recombination protein RecA